jgi:hypothetical protein
MNDPGSSISLTAVLVLTVVVLVLMAGWLGAVFLAARETHGGSARRDEEDPGHAGQPEPGAHPGDVPAGHPARPAQDDGTGEPRARADRTG